MAHVVNLDALIPREDFEIADSETPASPTATLQIRNLERGDFFYSVVKKPDFQRETSDWNPQKIADFVQSFLDGDLIPALILWQAGSHIFVIDGAHRLSALIAWVHDDYGDGQTSKEFFDRTLPEEQVKAAEYTRQLVKRQLGSYADHQYAVQNPQKSKPEVIARARRLGSLALQLQWVKGDARKAEASFFKINQQASPIDKTELRLLKARRQPNALAARAIVRAGTGHKYWSTFDAEHQSSIESLAKGVNELLFSPSLKTPIKTLDLPVAGRGYSSQTLPLVFEFVNLANDVKGETTDDSHGDSTVTLLRQCKRIMDRVSGTHPSSLGLHPAVYFYSATGRYQPTAFLATVALLRDLDSKDRLKAFTGVRREFEEFLVKHKIFVNQVTVKYGSGVKGYAPLQKLFALIVEWLDAKKPEAQMLEDLQSHPDFNFLQPAETVVLGGGKDFSGDVKSAVFLRDALRDPLRCKICGGLVHRNSISIDHIQRRADGGTGVVDNGQLTHPYCNTTVKN